MPGFPVPFIKFREDTADGKPLAGGLLYSYAAGTSTPLATYFDQDLAVGHENQNPTILDASGRANVWIPDGVGYKFLLTDALGNQVYSQDRVMVSAAAASTGGGGGTTPPPTTTDFPVGGILPYAGSVAPAGWLLCDGAGISRSTYSDLFNVCGETYGSGNGSTTFNLPNLVQRFPLGKATSGTGATLGTAGGQIDHVHSGPSHTHPTAAHHHTVPAHAHTTARDAFGPSVPDSMPARPNEVVLAGGGGGGFFGSVSAPTSTLAAAVTDDVTVTVNSSGTANTGTANPPFLVLNFIIKT